MDKVPIFEDDGLGDTTPQTAVEELYFISSELSKDYKNEATFLLFTSVAIAVGGKRLAKTIEAVGEEILKWDDLSEDQKKSTENVVAQVREELAEASPAVN